MGLTYDGITYRSLEEQVRYDAEQVQILKQADVTIDENLQTINAEIDGKLTKPTNPSAESAVTMLADGTVGTKLLSEIGGSGGDVKLYLHRISASLTTEQAGIYVYIINTSNTKITENQYFMSYIGHRNICIFSGRYGVGAVGVGYNTQSNNYTIIGATASTENAGTGYFLNITDGFKSFTDTVTEL